MYTLHHGDCLDIMPTLEANSVDTIITDPPYGLSFMGKDWDHGVPGVAFWREALRVAKPGAMLLAFGGTRTFHRLTCAIEDAGWEVRDVVSWLYGSGFPKSLDISKAIDKAAGAEREVICLHPHAASSLGNGVNMSGGKAQDVVNITAPATPAAQQWHGWGTALKPAWEPVILAMKPLDGTFAENALTWGVAGLAIDKGRIDYVSEADKGDPNRFKTAWSGNGSNPGWQREAHKDYKPVPVGSNGGRWPANLILDEDAAAALDAQSGERPSSARPNSAGKMYGAERMAYGKYADAPHASMHDDSGGVSRFFYVAKASRAERNAGLEGLPLVKNDFQRASSGLNQDRPGREGRKPMEGAQNHHPCVKPVSLMRYLCRLTSTPTGGVVLDPFMGSGTTGVAALQEGRSFIGIEREAEYVEIARRRIAAAELPLLREAAD